MSLIRNLLSAKCVYTPDDLIEVCPGWTKRQDDEARAFIERNPPSAEDIEKLKEVAAKHPYDPEPKPRRRIRCIVTGQKA
jgi:hypothetical protein